MVDVPSPGERRRRELNLALEALHFAFRAVIEGPDAVLAEGGLSRVHHRLLFFIAKTPGVRVSELLATLGVTKQAMNGPLRQLTERGLVAETVDEQDRRGKHLRLTAQGRALEERLSGEQRAMFARAFRGAGKDSEQAWHEVMRRLAEGGGEAAPARAKRGSRGRARGGA